MQLLLKQGKPADSATVFSNFLPLLELARSRKRDGRVLTHLDHPRIVPPYLVANYKTEKKDDLKVAAGGAFAMCMNALNEHGAEIEFEVFVDPLVPVKKPDGTTEKQFVGIIVTKISFENVADMQKCNEIMGYGRSEHLALASLFRELGGDSSEWHPIGNAFNRISLEFGLARDFPNRKTAAETH